MSERELSVDELAEIRSAVELFWKQDSRARKYQIEDRAWVEAIIAEQWAIAASRLLGHLDWLSSRRDAAEPHVGEFG